LLTTTSDKTISKAIIDLGHNLGFRVVVEGVETEEQLILLKGLQCDEIQGYFISKPLDIMHLKPFLLEKRLKPYEVI
jgi:EAL domain-containing protein (putative c-di-GMP-specific phosphodiesterase class I)